MVTYDTVIKRALDIYYNRDKYCYFYGAKGVKLTNDNMNYLMNVDKECKKHFDKYTEEQKKKIKEYSIGKIGYDCSGFVGKCVDDMTYANNLFNHCTHKCTPVQGVAGGLLWKNGHIGIDIGYGYFLHFPTEMHTCELCKIKDYNWNSSGQHNNVDYALSNSR